jgi:signal transduction histidine kinase/CheY-like chemotaxis protein
MFLAVAVSGWYGGFGPGLLATILSAGVALYLFLDPAYTLQTLPLSYIVFTILFVLGGVVISVLSESMHRARDRAELSAQELRLEVEERERIAHELKQSVEREKTALIESEIAHRAKDEFLATVSHELRTPLNSMLGWAQMLQTGRLTPEDTTNAYETIERNAKHQAQLIEDVLDVSRIITGKVRLDVKPIEPIAVIEHAIEIVRPTADARGVTLQTDLDPKAGPISGDDSRLQQVVWNLLSNAIKFTAKGGVVQIRLVRVESHIEIVVSDTGQGIEPAFLPFAFDRFRQEVGSSSRLHGGMGLGLAIVRHLVELHGGSVEAESKGKGKGSVFTVKLPILAAFSSEDLVGVVAADPGSAARRGLPFAFEPVLSGVRVLIAEDEADARELIQMVLSGCGADVKACPSAAECFDELQTWKPDVLVSDVGMPGEDGYSLIRRIRKLPADQGGKIPAMALTAYARVEDRVKALSAGFQTHAPKPVEPRELVAAVASLAKSSPTYGTGASAQSS